VSLTNEEIYEAISKKLPKLDNETPSTVLGAGSDDLEAGRNYLEALVEDGWMLPTWPKKHGGRDSTPEEASMISRTLGLFKGADLYPYGVGLSLVGPILMDLGTDEQMDRWLLPIANGSEIWCQMFSEPDAGSDLANVGMSAEKDGEDWVLNGSKVWTSRGAYSKWGMCLARTNPETTKHAGLTMFALDMDSPGVEVRTIEQMNGDRHFSEIFISDVVVEDRNRIGGLGDGWKIAVNTLALERSSLGGRSFGGGDQATGLPSWLEEWKLKGYLEDPVSRQKAMKAFTLHRVNQLTVSRAAVSGNNSGPAGSGAKLRSVMAFKFRAYLSKELFGAEGMLINDNEHIEFLTGPSMSIRGGTDEVQRNILGERVLGLPAEQRVDKELSYREMLRVR
tara:strand:- start:3212 stop:4390 length:1179 start_codon:yes stop_codon:yes gene_type:complete